MSEQKNKRYVTVKRYAELCGVGVHAIYARITKSNPSYKDDEDGNEVEVPAFYKEGEAGYLEQTLLDNAEGAFIDTKKFPPSKMASGRKHKAAN